MSYIGNTATQQAFTPAVDFFNGNGSTTAFTLSRPVASVAQVQAVISNVPQKPGDAFTVSGNTITFTSAPPSGTSNIYVYYTSPITQVIAPGQNTVGTTQIQDNAITTAKIAAGAVTTAKLSSTTGTGAVALASLPSFTTTIGVGGATASASGSGVSFPATQNPSSDANTLDDYEEGTWTPAINLLGTLTYANQAGRYVKIGKWVTVIVQISVSSTDTTQDTGSTLISGLPFTCSNTDPTGFSAVMTEQVKGTNSATAPNTFFASAENNLTTIRIYANNYNGSVAQKSYFATLTRNFYSGSNAYFFFTATYIATS
jgi:hypothetical protein